MCIRDSQVAVHANTYGIYPSEIAALQKDYADLWAVSYTHLDVYKRQALRPAKPQRANVPADLYGGKPRPHSSAA